MNKGFIFNKMWAIIIFIIISSSAFNTCKMGDGTNGSDNEDPDFYIVNISKEADWDYLVFWTDGTSIFYNVDESGEIPTRMFFKPDKDSDDGLVYMFHENGFPALIIHDEHIIYLDNFGGTYLDIAEINPDGTIVYHFDIDTKINWEDTIEILNNLSVRNFASRSARETSLQNAASDNVGKSFSLIRWAVETGPAVKEAITSPFKSLFKTVGNWVGGEVLDSDTKETIDIVITCLGGPLSAGLLVAETTWDASSGMVNHHANNINIAAAEAGLFERFEEQEITSTRPPESKIKEKEFYGVVTYSPKEDVFLGTELTATYKGVVLGITFVKPTFQWYNYIEKVGTASDANPNKFTPTEVGSYNVELSKPGYKTRKFYGGPRVLSSGNWSTSEVYAAGREENDAVLWTNGVRSVLPKTGSSAVAYLVYVSDETVYVVGRDGNDAVLWTNGVRSILPKTGSSAVALSVYVSGGTVYATGQDGNDAVLWTNGVRSVLPRTSSSAYGYSLYISGGSVYVIGPDGNDAVLWTNGVRSVLPKTGSTALARLVYISGGIVYVVGTDGNDAVLWTNGVRSVLPKTGISATAWSVYTSDDTVYVSGTNGDDAVLWTNGVRSVLPKTRTSANAYSVYVSGGTVYIAGSDGNDAVIWANGESLVLPKTGGLAYVNSVFVVD
ncbi:MAG: hypothetical protein FWD14_04465 [Treponema sp.]|nr:hypothetical protein [Treponema sp.]